MPRANLATGHFKDNILRLATLTFMHIYYKNEQPGKRKQQNRGTLQEIQHLSNRNSKMKEKNEEIMNGQFPRTEGHESLRLQGLAEPPDIKG